VQSGLGADHWWAPIETACRRANDPLPDLGPVRRVRRTAAGNCRADDRFGPTRRLRAGDWTDEEALARQRRYRTIATLRRDTPGPGDAHDSYRVKARVRQPCVAAALDENQSRCL
jgi:hypothetical protein